MSNFQSYKTITDRLKSLGDKLSKSKLSAEELDEFESLSRQLFERVLILNYKAKEVKVHGEETVAQESKVNEKPKTPVKEESKTRLKEEEEESDTDTGEIQFDFSSEIKDDTANIEEVQDVQEEPKEEATSSEPQEEVQESVEEEVKENEEISEVTINDNFDTEKEQSFYERFQKVHNDSIGDRLGASKLSTLKNAIGLNDKMQFISELFSGDNDAFNKSIEALDQQPSNEDARKTLSQIASKHAWDEENPLVEEFARLIERRYVED